MTSLSTIIHNEIRRRKRVTFAEFMGWALYHPQHGYYTAHTRRTGRTGDFYTNVQVGPLFGQMLAETFMEMWDYLGNERITIVELGASDGALAETVLRALQAKDRDKGVSYIAVEKSPHARETLRKRLARFRKIHILNDLADLEHTSGVGGIIFSNEFFDALPVHRVFWKEGRLRELYVEEKGGALREVPGGPSTPRLQKYLEEQSVRLAEGQRTEICLALDAVVPEIERCLSRGFVLTIDYGTSSQELHSELRPEGTLQVYRQHQRLDDPFEHLGDADITVLVDFTRLADLGRKVDLQPMIYVAQGPFLINSSEKYLKEVIEPQVREGKDLSPAKQLQQLVHPQSFGGKYQVLIQGKNVADANLSGGKINRIHRLTPVAAK